MAHSHFPVINSTLSPAHLATWVEQQYGFTGVSCRLLKTFMNHTYVVTTGDEQYVLRVYNQKHRDKTLVSEEVQLLNEIKDKVSVSYPIANAKGELVNEIDAPEGTRCAVLFSYATGKKTRFLSIKQSQSIGVQIGNMHAITQNKTIRRFDYSIDRLVDWAHQQLAQYFSPQLEEMQFIQRCGKALKEIFNSMELSKGIVHLDIWYDNMSIDNNGTITLIDFDNCGNGWLILDIGYYCMQLWFVETDKAEYEQKKNAFIDGYRSVIPVSDNELELISYAGLAIWTHYLGVQAQRFDTLGNMFLSENYIRMMINRVQEWLKYNHVDIPAD